MNMEVRQLERSAKARVGIVDCDIHPRNSLEDLRPYLSNRWWDYLQTYGQRQRHGYVKGYMYPKSQPLACRRDAWPPGGGVPASDLDFMREQLLDLYGIDYAVMNPLSPSGQGNQYDELSAAMGFATNEYQLENWNRREPRLKASVVIPYEDAQGFGEGDQAAGRRPPVRACAVPEPHQRAAWARSATGRSSRRRSRPGCRSACTCSAPAGARCPTPAGRRSTSRRSPSIRRRCRPRSRA